MAGVGPQLEGDAARVAHRLQPVLGHADQDLELVAARQLDHALALRPAPGRPRQHRGDDAGGVGAQLGVGEVVLGGGELAPGLVDRASVVEESDCRVSSVWVMKAALPRSAW
jgi:hypothetical protein